MTEQPRLNLVVLHSPDIERLRSFYEFIGLTFVHEKHGDGPSHYACNTGGAVLEIYPAVRDVTSSPSLGFSFPNLDAIIDTLEKKAIPFSFFNSQYRRYLTIRDPDGRSIHLTETK